MPDPIAPAAPAKPAASAPAPAASPAPKATPSADLNDAPVHSFEELDAAFKKAGSDLAPKPATPPKQEGGEPPAPAAAASPKPGDKPVATVKPITGGPKELREELERTRGELKTNAEAKAALETKIKEYESKGKDTEGLLARLESRDKEFEQLQGELRALKQEASPEFKERYEKPFNQAASFAETIVKQAQKADGTAADFDKDFIPLYRMPYNAAYKQAREVFGDDVAPIIMEQVRELQKLDFVKRNAFEDEKKGWAEKEKQREGLKVQQREQFNDAWKKVNKDLQDSVEEYRDPVDDKEAQTIRQNGYAIVDASTKTPKENLLKNAHIRHRVAAYGVQRLIISRQEAKIAELTKQLEETKQVQPGLGNRRPGGEAAPVHTEGWEEGLRRAVK